MKKRFKSGLAGITNPPLRKSVDGGLNVSSYDAFGGYGNAYPNIVKNIMLNSPVAYRCIEQYARFLRGNGLGDDFDKVEVNYRQETIEDILKKASKDYALFRGFALHFNYDEVGMIKSIIHLPFEDCRLAYIDDLGYPAKIAYSRIWDNRDTNANIVGNTHLSEDDIMYYHRFNPQQEVVFSQRLSDESNGLTFRGQVLYFSEEGIMDYPVSRLHSVINDAEVDYNLSRYRKQQTKQSFLKKMIVHYKAKVDDLEDEEFESNYRNIQKQLGELQGSDSESSTLLIMGDEESQETLDIRTLESTHEDGAFSSTLEESKHAIMERFAIPPVLYGDYANGLFNQQQMQDAFMVFNEQTREDRKTLESKFMKILKHWFNSDFEGVEGIIPLSFGFSEDESDEMNEEEGMNVEEENDDEL